MVILTIAFKKGGKGYDYLLLNPERAKIDRDKPLKIVTGSGPRDYIPVRALAARKAEVLPTHVKKAIRLYGNNEARMGEMPAPRHLPKTNAAPLEKQGSGPIDPGFYGNFVLRAVAKRMRKSMKGGK